MVSLELEFLFLLEADLSQPDFLICSLEYEDIGDASFSGLLPAEFFSWSLTEYVWCPMQSVEKAGYSPQTA